MADITDKIITKYYDNKIISIQEYLAMKGGLSYQGLSYAIERDRVDYAIIAGQRVIVLTEKSIEYTPNKNKTRVTSVLALKRRNNQKI